MEATTGFSLSGSLAVASEDTQRLGLARIRSTFYHAIALGTFINLVFPFVLADFIAKGTIKRKVLLAQLALALIVAHS